MIENKTCKHCGKEFTPIKNDARLVYCSKECRLADRKSSDYNKRYYEANKERFAEGRKSDKYKKMRKRYNERRRERYKVDEEYRHDIRRKVKNYQDSHPEARLAQRIKKYGITVDEYMEMYMAQDGKCAICGAEVGNAEGDRLYVDHNHRTGKVRGILCSNCNLGIGKFFDNIELLRKAIQYLEDADGTDSDMV